MPSLITGVPTTISDFIDQVVSFAVAQAGFTDEGSVTQTSGTTLRRISKNSIYWNFEHTLSHTSGTRRGNYINMRMTYSLYAGTAFSTTVPADGHDWHVQCSTHKVTGPFQQLYLYSDGNVVHAALETVPNVFTHLSFGTMLKFGTFTGGEYVSATSFFDSLSTGTYTFGRSNAGVIFGDSVVNGRQSGAVRNSVGGNDSTDFAALSNQGTVQEARMAIPMIASNGLSSSGWYNELYTHSPNQANNRAVMLPVYCRLRDTNIATTETALYHADAYVPNVRFLNMGGLAAKDLILTNWRVFPLSQTFGDLDVATATFGFAVAYLED